MLLPFLAGILASIIFGMVMFAVFVVGFLLLENRGHGIKHNLVKTARETLWVFRLRKTID